MIKAADLIEKFRFALNNGWGYIYGAAGKIWTQDDQNSATREQTRLYGQRWVGKHVVDCSGLFSWAFKSLGGYMYHGSNRMWNKYCTSQGDLTASSILRPGTAVFTGSETDKGHVGLFVGGMEVIEAAGTKAGVIASKVTDKKWKYWGELLGVEYGDDGQPMPDLKPTIKRGSKGKFVTLAQTQLLNKGYDLGKWGVDGDFGSATEAAVKAFQNDAGLNVDGVIGDATWKALDSPIVLAKYTVTIKGLQKSQAELICQEYTGASMKKEGD